jgi:hypothetical protein
VKYLPLLLNKQVMTQEQMEHALKVMYEEIKQLKVEVKGLETTLDMFYTIDLDGTTKKRDYWNTHEHKNR